MRNTRVAQARRAHAWPREVVAPTPPKQQPVWLFDLDDTLHNASHAIFPAIMERMNDYIARVLGDDCLLLAVRQTGQMQAGEPFAERKMSPRKLFLADPELVKVSWANGQVELV